MKSNKINWYDLEDVEVVIAFVEVLATLIQRDPVEEVIAEVLEIEAQFCRSCDAHEEYCECNREYARDEDYEYDCWKDRQLEEEADAKSD